MYELISRTSMDDSAIVIRHMATGKEVAIAEGLTDAEHGKLLEGAMLALWGVEQINKAINTKEV